MEDKYLDTSVFLLKKAGPIISFADLNTVVCTILFLPVHVPLSLLNELPRPRLSFIH